MTGEPFGDFVSDRERVCPRCAIRVTDLSAERVESPFEASERLVVLESWEGFGVFR